MGARPPPPVTVTDLLKLALAHAGYWCTDLFNERECRGEAELSQRENLIDVIEECLVARVGEAAGAVLGGVAQQAGDEVGGVGVELADEVVEDEESGSAYEGSSERNALLLAGRRARASEQDDGSRPFHVRAILVSGSGWDAPLSVGQKPHLTSVLGPLTFVGSSMRPITSTSTRDRHFVLRKFLQVYGATAR